MEADYQLHVLVYSIEMRSEMKAQIVAQGSQNSVNDAVFKVLHMVGIIDKCVYYNYCMLKFLVRI